MGKPIRLMSREEGEKDFSYHTQYITSTAASVCIRLKGLKGNRFKTPKMLWRQLVEKKIEEINPEDDEILADKLLAGSILEKAIIEMANIKQFELFKGKTIKQGTQIYGRDDIPWIADNPDAFLWNDKTGKVEGVVEVKNVGELSETSWADGVPDYYYWQVVHHNLVLGLPCYVLALFGGYKLKLYEVFIPEEDRKLLFEAEEALWNMVRDKIEPMAFAEDVVGKINYGKETSIEAKNKIKELLKEYFKLQEEADKLDDITRKMNDLKARIMDIMESKKVITDIATVSIASRKIFDEDSFQADNPDLSKEFLVLKFDEKLLKQKYHNLYNKYKIDKGINYLMIRKKA